MRLLSIQHFHHPLTLRARSEAFAVAAVAKRAHRRKFAKHLNPKRPDIGAGVTYL